MSDPYHKYSHTSIVNLDDPYWKEFYERNHKATDHFRLPSALAWDYKEDGFIGELFDLKKLRKDAEYLSKKM